MYLKSKSYKSTLKIIITRVRMTVKITSRLNRLALLNIHKEMNDIKLDKLFDFFFAKNILDMYNLLSNLFLI